MALDRKDIRAKLDPDMHSKLVVLCEVDNVDIGEFIESLLIEKINKRCYDASVIASRVARLGISGNNKE